MTPVLCRSEWIPEGLAETETEVCTRCPLILSNLTPRLCLPPRACQLEVEPWYYYQLWPQDPRRDIELAFRCMSVFHICER